MYFGTCMSHPMSFHESAFCIKASKYSWLFDLLYLCNWAVEVSSRWHWLCYDCLIPEVCRPLHIEYNRFDEAMKSNYLEENYEWYTTIQYHSLFFIFFIYFHIKKSVSNWHQSEVWKKKTSTSSQTTFKGTIPLSSSPSSSEYLSFVCLILSIHHHKNAVLNWF